MHPVAFANGVKLAGRGFSIVVLTSMNVYQIAHQHYLGAFSIGAAISVVWWGNAKRSGHDDVPYAALWYGLGAGIGTVTGMALMRLLYG